MTIIDERLVGLLRNCAAAGSGLATDPGTVFSDSLRRAQLLLAPRAPVPTRAPLARRPAPLQIAAHFVPAGLAEAPAATDLHAI